MLLEALFAELSGKYVAWNVQWPKKVGHSTLPQSGPELRQNRPKSWATKASQKVQVTKQTGASLHETNQYLDMYIHVYMLMRISIYIHTYRYAYTCIHVKSQNSHFGAWTLRASSAKLRPEGVLDNGCDPGLHGSPRGGPAMPCGIICRPKQKDMHTYKYIYIYIYRERLIHIHIVITYIHIYIYTHICVGT